MRAAKGTKMRNVDSGREGLGADWVSSLSITEYAQQRLTSLTVVSSHKLTTATQPANDA